MESRVSLYCDLFNVWDFEVCVEGKVGYIVGSTCNGTQYLWLQIGFWIYLMVSQSPTVLFCKSTKVSVLPCKCVFCYSGIDLNVCLVVSRAVWSVCWFLVDVIYTWYSFGLAYLPVCELSVLENRSFVKGLKKTLGFIPTSVDRVLLRQEQQRRQE